MRVLFLSSLDFKEKSIAVIRKTPEAYVAAGWDVTYIVARDTAANGNYSYEAVIDPPGMRIQRFRWPLPRLREKLRGPLLAATMQVAWYGVVLKLAWKGFWEARRAIASPSQSGSPNHGYDVLYGYEAAAVLAAALVRIGLWLTRSPRPKTVSRFMGVWYLNRHFDERRYARLAAMGGWLAALYLPADLCIMTDDGTQGLTLLQRIKTRTPRLRFFVNGVDPPLEASRETEIDWPALGVMPGETVIAAINRLAPAKRMDRCLRAFASVLQQAPSPQAASRLKLLVVGEGAERPRLEMLAETLGVAGQTVFTGAVRQSIVSLYLQRAQSVFLFSSATNAGNGMLEALRHGKLIFALDNGDTARWIHHFETGCLFAEDDATLAEQVAAAYWRVDGDAALRTEIEKNVARLAGERLWSWQERLAEELRTVESLFDPQPASQFDSSLTPAIDAGAAPRRVEGRHAA